METVKNYWCSDGQAGEWIAGVNPKEAAQEWFEGGDWHDTQRTTRVIVWVGDTEDGTEHGQFEFFAQPEEPKCDPLGTEHDLRFVSSVGNFTWEKCNKCGWTRTLNREAHDSADSSSFEQYEWEAPQGDSGDNADYDYE